MGMSPQELAQVIANIALVTSRSPETANAAQSVNAVTQTGLSKLYEERKRDAEKKAKKGSFLTKAGKIAGSILGGPVGGAIGGTIGAQLGGSENSFFEDLGNMGIEAAGNMVLSEGIGDLAGRLKTATAVKGAGALEAEKAAQSTGNPTLRVPERDNPGILSRAASKVGAGLEKRAGSVQSGVSNLVSSLTNYQPGFGDAAIPVGLNPQEMHAIDERYMQVARDELNKEMAFSNLELAKRRTSVDEGHLAEDQKRTGFEERRVGLAEAEGKRQEDMHPLAKDLAGVNLSLAQKNDTNYESPQAARDAEATIQLDRLGKANELAKELENIRFGNDKTLRGIPQATEETFVPIDYVDEDGSLKVTGFSHKTGKTAETLPKGASVASPYTTNGPQDKMVSNTAMEVVRALGKGRPDEARTIMSGLSDEMRVKVKQYLSLEGLDSDGPGQQPNNDFEYDPNGRLRIGNVKPADLNRR